MPCEPGWSVMAMADAHRGMADASNTPGAAAVTRALTRFFIIVYPRLPPIIKGGSALGEGDGGAGVVEGEGLGEAEGTGEPEVCAAAGAATEEINATGAAAVTRCFTKCFIVACSMQMARAVSRARLQCPWAAREAARGRAWVKGKGLGEADGVAEPEVCAATGDASEAISAAGAAAVTRCFTIFFMGLFQCRMFNQKCLPAISSGGPGTGETDGVGEGVAEGDGLGEADGVSERTPGPCVSGRPAVCTARADDAISAAGAAAVTRCITMCFMIFSREIRQWVAAVLEPESVREKV